MAEQRFNDGVQDVDAVSVSKKNEGHSGLASGFLTVLGIVETVALGLYALLAVSVYSVALGDEVSPAAKNDPFAQYMCFWLFLLAVVWTSIAWGRKRSRDRLLIVLGIHALGLVLWCVFPIIVRPYWI